MKRLTDIFIKKPLQSVLWLCFTIGLLQLISVRWWDNNWQDMISSDAFGYYAYLPSTFIYHDFQYGYAKEMQDTYHAHDQSPYFFAPSHDGKLVNKYYVGTALCMLPFFIIAHITTLLTGYQPDGFSFWYAVFISFGTLCYTIVGLYFLAKALLLKKYTIRPISFVIACLFLCTNLYYYSVHEAAMSHAYSFFFISLFIYLVLSFQEKRRTLLLLGISLGMIIAIRPSNLIIITALPFLLENKESLFDWFKRVFSKPKNLILPIFLLLLPIGIQSVFYYLQCGKFWVYAYQGESFDFAQPHIMASLFSAERGMFVWTPWMLLLIPSIIISIIKKIYIIISFTFFFILIFYLLSSWHIWFYGGGFGLRPYIDFYPVFAFMIMYGITDLLGFNIVKPFLFLFAACCLFLNLFQQYQYRLSIIPYMGVTQKSYWQVFLQTGKQFRFMMSPDKDVLVDTFSVGKGIWFSNHFDGDTVWRKTNSLADKISYSAPFSIHLNQSNLYSPVLSFRLTDSLSVVNYVVVKAMIFQQNVRHNTQVVLSVENEDHDIILWRGHYIIHDIQEEQKWLPYFYMFDIPNGIRQGQKAEVYFYKQDKSDLYIDDVKVGFY
ncbi:MAG: hypothetical protein LC101_03795 [Flavobacteriales bacterium]|nr:hypothetical protein [Flavobacteriales bacterium]